MHGCRYLFGISNSEFYLKVRTKTWESSNVSRFVKLEANLRKFVLTFASSSSLFIKKTWLKIKKNGSNKDFTKVFKSLRFRLFM